MNGTNHAWAMGPSGRIDATWRLATASRLVRVVLAMALCLSRTAS